LNAEWAIVAVQIAVMGSKGAVEIIYRSADREEGGGGGEAAAATRLAQYEDKFNSPFQVRLSSTDSIRCIKLTRLGACHGAVKRGNPAPTPPSLQAAKLGFIDDVILPRHTRRRVCAELELLRGKQVAAPRRKHANMPL
jgi:propionyl-CoA carboxylase beta chain